MPRLLLALAGALAAGALAGCPPSRYVRDYPRWIADGGRDLRVGCAIADAFVRTSGKEGVGVTVEVRSLGDCDARITSAAMVFPGGSRVAAELPDQPALRGRSLVYRWIALPFDGDRAWNDGVRSAALELEVRAGGASRRWRIPLTQRFDHRWRDSWSAR
jgi:hypothetical protein